ncbi:YjcZ-like family protein [Desulfococcaceae bacterium OttesenSCG-928-F15]|nr:YjcZ-like family protein [Desulfococcaceae bacterium OttesenSCG-928-F15]
MVEKQNQTLDRLDPLFKELPPFKDKFVVDFITSIHVAEDHIASQQQSKGKIKRFLNAFSGKSSRQQSAINQELWVGLKVTLDWFQDASKDQTKLNIRTQQLCSQIESIHGDIVTLAENQYETRELVEELKNTISNTNAILQSKIARIDLTQKALSQLDRVFHAWEAGRYQFLSFGGRLYTALENLRWGDFGIFWQNLNSQTEKKEIMADIINRATIQLGKDLKEKKDFQPVLIEWITHPPNQNPDIQMALAYLGDWTKPDKHPFSFITTHTTEPPSHYLPKFFGKEKIANRMFQEFF